MGDLMRGGAEDSLQRLDRRVAVVRREEPRAVRDRARVLHRARFEVGDADRVHLYVRIRDRRVVLEPLHRAHMRVARVDALLGETRRKANPDGDPGRSRHGRRELVRPDGEGDEVRGDLRRLAEPRAGAALVDRFFGRDGHVGDRLVPGRVNELEREARLELGLVEAGKRPSSVGRLELGRGVALLAAKRPIQTAERVTNAALP